MKVALKHRKAVVREFLEIEVEYYPVYAIRIVQSNGDLTFSLQVHGR